MKVEAKTKLGIDKKRARLRALHQTVTVKNNTGLSDGTVLAILAAKQGRWSPAMTADEAFRCLDIK